MAAVIPFLPNDVKETEIQINVFKPQLSKI